MKKSIVMSVVVSGLCLAGIALANPPQKPPQKPPMQAIEACQDLAAGDACTFASSQGEVAGMCFTPDSSKPLACKPAEPPPPPPEAVEACADLEAGDACVVETPGGEMEGSCESPDESHPLACVPPQGKGPQPPQPQAQ
jgi:hypothetical protein